MQLLINFGLLIIGFVLLVKGADIFVEGAASIAKKFGIPQLVIGLTIVAMGTSLPEAAVSIASATKGSASIAIGNVVGSNILNVLVVLGITGIITGVGIQKSTFRFEIPFMLGVTVVMVLFGMTSGVITSKEGIFLWILFLIFLGYLFVLSRKGNGDEDEEVADMPVWKCLLFIIPGALMIVFGSDVAVNGATGIARIFGMSERFIGLTIVALGTSLPELVTSVTAACKGNTDIAIGNIVGSNLFNVLFVIGTTALIIDVPFDPGFLVDASVAIFAGILLWVGTMKHKELRKSFSVIMLLVYVGYFSYLCIG